MVNSNEKLAYAINSTGGKEIKNKLKNIIHKFANNEIDYKTACKAINKEFNSRSK